MFATESKRSTCCNVGSSLFQTGAFPLHVRTFTQHLRDVMANGGGHVNYCRHCCRWRHLDEYMDVGWYCTECWDWWDSFDAWWNLHFVLLLVRWDSPLHWVVRSDDPTFRAAVFADEVLGFWIAEFARVRNVCDVSDVDVSEAE